MSSVCISMRASEDNMTPQCAAVVLYAYCPFYLIARNVKRTCVQGLKLSKIDVYCCLIQNLLLLTSCACSEEYSGFSGILILLPCFVLKGQQIYPLLFLLTTSTNVSTLKKADSVCQFGGNCSDTMDALKRSLRSPRMNGSPCEKHHYKIMENF